MQFIIIGNGITGISAAKTLREHHPAARVTVYTNEIQTGLYQRKDLARHLAAATLDEHTIFSESNADLARAGIKVIYDPVLRVFARHGSVLINHAIRQTYDRLLIATGATPRLLDAPGYHLLGVHQARNYEDFAFMDNWVDEMQAVGAVVIGGGVLGMDLAYALAARQVPTTLVVRESHLGMPYLNAEQSAAATAALRSHGVQIRLNETVAAFDSDDMNVLDRVVLAGGDVLPVRLAISCIGVAPNTDFLEDSGIEVDEESGAVIVNDLMQTNFPAVYAAGGCALVQGKLAYNWQLSAEQGRVAALNMLGQDTAYAYPEVMPVPLPLVLQGESAPSPR